MNVVWIVSMVLQWGLLAVLCLLVLSLIRQMGTINIRINALRDAEGLALYSRLPPHQFDLIDGSTRTLGGEQKRASLVVFFSTSCSACEALPGALAQMSGNGVASEIDLVGVIAAGRDEAIKFVADKSLQGVQVAISGDFPEHYIPRQGVPYAVAITSAGLIAAVGKPKTLTHLREMVQAATKTADLATTHSIRSHDWGDSVPYWSAEQVAT